MFLLLALHALAGQAAPSDPVWWPDHAFAQVGVAEEAHTATVGLTWRGRWDRPWAGGVLEGYWEGSFGRWSSEQADGRSASAWVTQVGLTPVLRWTPAGSRCFAEVGIGVNLLMPVYHNKEKRFSTTFNFGDHVAMGLRFGDHDRHELALRLQHFSNAGIRHPNPGENFLQLRYTHAL